MLADWRCEKMCAKHAAVGGSGGTPPGNFLDFKPSEVVSDAILG